MSVYEKIGNLLGRVITAVTGVHERQDFATQFISDGEGGTKEVNLPTGVFHSDGSIEAVIIGNEAADQIHKMTFGENQSESNIEQKQQAHLDARDKSIDDFFKSSSKSGDKPEMTNSNNLEL